MCLSLATMVPDYKPKIYKNNSKSFNNQLLEWAVNNWKTVYDDIKDQNCKKMPYAKFQWCQRSSKVSRTSLMVTETKAQDSYLEGKTIGPRWHWMTSATPETLHGFFSYRFRSNFINTEKNIVYDFLSFLYNQKAKYLFSKHFH